MIALFTGISAKPLDGLLMVSAAARRLCRNYRLGSLLQQPHLTADSWRTRPFTALTDPLLASHPGRSLTLGGWLLIGRFLASR